MLKERLKLLIWCAVILATALIGYGGIHGLGMLITYFSSGADPATALKLVPAVPLDLDERITWLADFPTVGEGRVMEPYTRDQIAGAYLHGWAQWEISYELGQPYGLKTYFSTPALEAAASAVTTTIDNGWEMRQSALHHTLQLAFYSDDGSIVSFTDQRAEVVRQLKRTDSSFQQINENADRYDVTMRLEDGNWRIRDLVRRGEADSRPVTVTQSISSTKFVQVEGNQLLLDGKPYSVIGINYYPQASPWTQFWPAYQYTQTVVDLGLVHSLGFNTVRIFVAYSDFGADKVEATHIRKLTHFLDQAEAHQLKVIITLFDHHTDHRIGQWAADDRHLAGLIPHFSEHPAILAWDIKNEANRDYGFNTPELTDAWLRHIAKKVRNYDTNHLLTIGWSTPEAAIHLTDLVDFVSFHYFEDSANYSERLSQLFESVPDKPVLLQEFVMSTWNSIWPHGHTEEEQALYYADLLRQHRNFDTAGYMVWTLYDFDRVPLAEFRLPWQQATQAHMGLVRRDGTLKPSANLFAPNASLDLVPLLWWHRWVKPFWFFIYGCGLVGMVALWWIVRWWRRSNQRVDPVGK